MVAANREQRTLSELKQHYDVERELSDRLRNSSRGERTFLYSLVYDELFQRVTSHPQLRLKESVGAADREQRVDAQLRFLRRYVTARSTFVEIGAGDCALSLRMAPEVDRVVAVDVSTEITSGQDRPKNFELVISDGTSVPVPPGSVDLVFSNQLMEHLHPDDALDQLREIHEALAPGGVYVCVTPNRVSGPHDISRIFDNVATGFHLKEYSTGQLTALFRDAGFSRLRVRPAGMGGRGPNVCLPPMLPILFERAIEAIPIAVRKKATANEYLSGLLGIWMIATK
jgi:SAM-dependent methyltransferase